MNSEQRGIQRVSTREASALARPGHSHTTLARLNDHEVVLAVNEDVYPWHRHSTSDEFFLVLEGVLHLETRDEPAVRLAAGEAAVVPIGVEHRTRPEGRVVNLIVKRTGADTRFTTE